MRGTIFQQSVRYAEYDVSGMLHSWWRKPAGEKDARYIEKLHVLAGRKYVYGAEFNSGENDDRDGWPFWLPQDLKPPRRKRVKAEDLLS